MEGGRRSDTFSFLDNSQSDLIADFTSGQDRIEFQIEGVSFTELQFTQNADTAIVNLRDMEIRLEAVDSADLAQDDFIF